MNKRIKRLSPADAAAVDLILDHGAQAVGTAASGRQRATSVAKVSTVARVAAITKLLSTLDAINDIDPPADLVARTMARIDQANDQADATREVRVPAAVTAHVH